MEGTLREFAHLPQEPEVVWVDFARHALRWVVVVELLSRGKRVKAQRVGV